MEPFKKGTTQEPSPRGLAPGWSQAPAWAMTGVEGGFRVWGFF